MSQEKYLDDTLEQHLQGDERGTANLIQALSCTIRKYISYALELRRAGCLQRESQIIDDISQETFYCLFRKDNASLKSYESKGGMNLEAYVGRIARRETNNHLDRLWAVKRGGRGSTSYRDASAKDRLSDFTELGPSPEDTMEVEQLVVHLDSRVKNRVSGKGYCAYRLLFHQGLETQQVSDILHQSTNAIHSWRRRLRLVALDILKEDRVLEGPNCGVKLAA